MSRTDTWMPLYIADYLADTMALSAIEHGAYLLLLMDYWRHGPLPNDDRKLSIIARVDRRAWNSSVRHTVRPFFFVGDDGRLHQKRIDVERTHALGLSEKRRVAAAAKWSAEHKRELSEAGFRMKSESKSEQLHSDCIDDAAECPNTQLVPHRSAKTRVSAAQKTEISAAQKNMLFPMPQSNGINDRRNAIASGLHNVCIPLAGGLQPSLSRDLVHKERRKEEREKDTPPYAPQGGPRRSKGRMPKLPIPDDWCPDDQDVAYAKEHRQPLTADAVSAFKDWHKIEGVGTGSVKASWRTWCRNAVRFGRCTPLPTERSVWLPNKI